MSKQLCIENFNKPKLSVHRILSISNRNKIINRFKYTNGTCKEGIYQLKSNNHILCEDRAKIQLYKYFKCNKSLWNYSHL